jgi:A/G-specific adenine glycosylase
MSPPLQKAFSRRVRAWYNRVGRDLPWRRTRDPYRVLVSELMLQQTQVSRVLGYYRAFLERFPTMQDVAAARMPSVLKSWSGLGYYARARNLHALARQLGDEALPSEPEQLVKLPGIGAYTAGAVASFAYEKRAALVDTNVARVLLRVFAPTLDPRTARGRRVAWRLAEATLPRTGRATHTHNQAVMELGALICTARVRHCHRCPVATVCATLSAGEKGSPPASRPRPEKSAASRPRTRGGRRGPSARR